MALRIEDARASIEAQLEGLTGEHRLRHAAAIADCLARNAPSTEEMEFWLEHARQARLVLSAVLRGEKVLEGGGARPRALLGTGKKARKRK